jgi:hypothetical protein
MFSLWSPPAFPDDGDVKHLRVLPDRGAPLWKCLLDSLPSYALGWKNSLCILDSNPLRDLGFENALSTLRAAFSLSQCCPNLS